VVYVRYLVTNIFIVANLGGTVTLSPISTIKIGEYLRLAADLNCPASIHTHTKEMTDISKRIPFGPQKRGRLSKFE
jgi:hypothetical protein